MNADGKNPSAAVGDEALNLIHDNVPSQVLTTPHKRHAQDMLARKSLTEHRLMRWCAFVLALGTLIIIWRFISILILAIWLSSICRPLLEWLVNHL